MQMGRERRSRWFIDMSEVFSWQACIKMYMKIMADGETNLEQFKFVFFILNTEIPSLELINGKSKTPIIFEVA